MIRSKQTPWSPPNQTSPEKSRTRFLMMPGNPRHLELTILQTLSSNVDTQRDLICAPQ